jgi:hypothetical protein
VTSFSYAVDEQGRSNYSSLQYSSSSEDPRRDIIAKTVFENIVVAEKWLEGGKLACDTDWAKGWTAAGSKIV